MGGLSMGRGAVADERGKTQIFLSESASFCVPFSFQAIRPANTNNDETGNADYAEDADFADFIRVNPPFQRHPRPIFFPVSLHLLLEYLAVYLLTPSQPPPLWGRSRSGSLPGMEG